MHLAYRALALAGLALSIHGITAAQQHEPAESLPASAHLDAQAPQRPRPRSITQNVGLHQRDGVWIGGGPDYETAFEAGSARFTPALPTADRLYPTTFTVTGYGRSAPELAPGAPVLAADGVTVDYRRPGFVERYEHRLDGLKQSFVFSQLPTGAGDLVVAMDIDTDLAPRIAGDGLQLLVGDIGVTIGAVVGIDADGARCAGSMSYEGQTLELRLPASFVDNAALPLVLDPLIAVWFVVSSGADDDDLDVAYDAANSVYCATWRRRFSAGNYAVRAQRLADLGPGTTCTTLCGGMFSIAATTTETKPRICGVATQEAFAIVWDDVGDIYGRALAAVDSATSLSAQAVIRDTADTMVDPDVGGEAVLEDEAVCVWTNATTGQILGRQVQVNGDVTPPTIAPLVSVVDITSASTQHSDSKPQISASGGATGRHCVVWQRQLNGTPETTVRARIISRNVGFLSGLMLVTTAADGDCDLPSVDGDGMNWVAAWEREATPGNDDNQIQARAIGYNPNGTIAAQGFLAGGIVDVDPDPYKNQRKVHAAWVGDAVLLTYGAMSTLTPTTISVYYVMVDTMTAEPCGAAMFITGPGSGGGYDRGPVRAASRASGGSELARALLVYVVRDQTTNAKEGYAAPFCPTDGASTNLGGSCGQGGTPFATCAQVGNSNFAARVRGTHTTAPSFWVLSPSRLDFGCGACTLIPDPWSGFTISVSTNIRGDASVPVSIPNDANLIGATFLHQWITVAPTTPACSLFGADLSDALRTTIE